GAAVVLLDGDEAAALMLDIYRRLPSLCNDLLEGGRRFDSIVAEFVGAGDDHVTVLLAELDEYLAKIIVLDHPGHLISWDCCGILVSYRGPVREKEPLFSRARRP